MICVVTRCEWDGIFHASSHVCLSRKLSHGPVSSFRTYWSVPCWEIPIQTWQSLECVERKRAVIGIYFQCRKRNKRTLVLPYIIHSISYTVIKTKIICCRLSSPALTRSSHDESSWLSGSSEGEFNGNRPVYSTCCRTNGTQPSQTTSCENIHHSPLELKNFASQLQDKPGFSKLQHSWTCFYV